MAANQGRSDAASIRAESSESVAAQYGINLFGLFTTPSGLGVAAENTRTVLRGLGLPLRVFDVDSSGVPRLLEEHQPSAVTWLNLFHLNPNWTDLLLRTPGGFDYRWHESLNAIVPFWELPRVSVDWVEHLAMFDAVLAPTRFILDALTASGVRSPVSYMPQAVYLPDGIAADRARFALDEGTVAFCMSFATGSLVARKNPLAVVDAFVKAFPEQEDARLVVRVHEQDLGGDDPALSELRRRAATDGRIVLVGGDLDYPGVLSLYASCDVYVSLHRSEGLGLGPMEAMSLGKPVIATGWSGNMDFMDASNACPVEFALVDAALGVGTLYGADMEQGDVQWAEPDIEHAASLMRALYADPALRETIGARAADSMARRRETASWGAAILELGERAEVLISSSDHAERSAILASYQGRANVEPAPRTASGLCARVRRLVRGVVRRRRIGHDVSDTPLRG